jgi:hypothetical protein
MSRWRILAALGLAVCAAIVAADGAPFEVSMEVLDSIEGVDGVVLELEPLETAGDDQPSAGEVAGDDTEESPAAPSPARQGEE